MRADDTTHTHHAIDYIELAVTDIEAAKAFYAAAFGWSLVDYGPEYAGIQGTAARRWAACDSIRRSGPAGRW